MSQKKVDAYKQKKANRDKIIKREKRILILEKAAGVVICLAVVAWLGYSVYGKVTQQEETKTTETVMDVSAVNEYTSELAEEVTDPQNTPAAENEIDETASDDTVQEK